MNHRVKKLKQWYNQRNLREKFLSIGLCWAFIYMIFNVFLLIPQEKRAQLILDDTKIFQTQIDDWNAQINAINQITGSVLYKKLEKQEQDFHSKSIAYRSLLHSSSGVNWNETIKSILFSEDNTIDIQKIKNFPEEPFNTSGTINNTSKIYQQKLLLIINSNYFDTITYLKRLQTALPTLHWDSLAYNVQQYPLANIEIEFSILYEKNDNN